MKEIYLILGSEAALAERALSKLQLQLKDESADITTLFADEVREGSIVDALSPSLFSQRRALILRELQDLAEDFRNEITQYLSAPDPTITLILVHKGGVKGKALLDQIRKFNPEIIICDPLKKEFEKEEFAKKLFLDLGRKATPAAISGLIAATGSDLRELSSAINQLAFDTPNGIIEENHVNKYHLGRVETTGFDVADKVIEGDYPAALISLRNAISTGTDPVMITSAIASALRGLAKVSGTNRLDKSFSLAGSLGMAPWQIDKARRQLSGWNSTTLKNAVIAIAKCDSQVKGGSSDPIYALEQAISVITAARSQR